MTNHASGASIARRLPAFAGAFLAAALVALSATAHAGGTILRIDGDDIYIDLGAADGVGGGSELTLYHIVIVKDPSSGQTLRDRFPLGALTVVKAGDRVCLASAPEGLKHRLRVGDEVELASASRTFNDPWQQRIAAQVAERDVVVEEARRPAKSDNQIAYERASVQVAAAQEVRDVWHSTLGRPPADRVVIWQEFLRNRPRTPYVAEIQREIGQLRAQIVEQERVSEQMADPQSRRVQMRIDRLAALESDVRLGDSLAMRAPTRIYEGSAVPLAITVLRPAEAARAWLYYRASGDDGFQRMELQPDGDAYLRGEIPATYARPAGIEYFVEIAAAPAAQPEPAIGSQRFPERINVEARVEEEAPDLYNRSRVTIFGDYVEFDGFGSDFDQYVHLEADFMYRFYKPVYAMRVGFGTLGGVGGPKDVIDESPDCIDDAGVYRCRRVSYSYAYTELEFRYSKNLAFMIRPQFGTGTSDRRPNTGAGRCDGRELSDCDLFSSFGLRARVRIGDELATNLTLGVGVTQDVGTLFEAAYTWAVIPRVPIKLAAQVTDQPVPEDFGVRLIGDVGVRVVDWVYPSVRLAYQARDVDHSGISAGLAFNFNW